MSGKLEIDGLRALRAIAESGGVTKAADRLALSQSGVSHKIRRLEESIGCRLLSRQAGAPSDDGGWGASARVCGTNYRAP